MKANEETGSTHSPKLGLCRLERQPIVINLTAAEIAQMEAQASAKEVRS